MLCRAASMNAPKAVAQPHTMPRHPSGLLSCSHVVTGWKESIPLGLPSPEGGQRFVSVHWESGEGRDVWVSPWSNQSAYGKIKQGKDPDLAVFTLAKLLAANCGSLA